mmetsp:Transcript_111136/g.314474  ORF Transcript_111136/g.314474 Transcript_111136/m.314474 type:complete len:147 (+) Transcript_111136:2-442(+)
MQPQQLQPQQQLQQQPKPRLEDLVAATFVSGLRQSAEPPAARASPTAVASAAAQPASTQANAEVPPRQRQQLFMKTQPCRFFAKGWCRSGIDCTFAHNLEEMRECPDLTKTSICHRWARHQCPRSARECRYAHGAGDLRRASANNA